MGDLMSGFSSLLDKGVTGFGNMFSGLLGGTEAAGQNQFMIEGSDGVWANATAGSPGAVQMMNNGNLTPDAASLGSDQINNLFDNKVDGKPFDIGSMANNAAKLGNMYSTFQDQKMKKQYFDEWKKNNAYMKEEAESQKKGRQRLAAELSGSSTNVA